MKRRYAIPLLLALCLVLVACVPKGGDVQAPTEDAAQRLQAVYDAIAGRWEKQEPLDCTVEVAGQENYRYHITPDNGYNVQSRSFAEYPIAWADADGLEDPAGAALTLTSADGETSLRCWEDSGAVELRQNGETVWLVSAPDANGFTLFQNLLSIPEDAAMEEAWDVTVDGEVTDYEEVAQRYAQAVGERLMDLPEWHSSHVLGIQNIQGHVKSAYTGEPENFCGHVGYYFDLEDGNSPWQIGSGMDQVTTGPYTGCWSWGIGASFARNDDGDWYCTGTYTGGEDLVYPVRQEEATVEQLVDYFFHTTGERAQLYRIPLELRRRGPEQLSALNDILDGYAQEEAQELCRVLGDHTKNWPDYEPVGYDELYALLKEPYRDWLSGERGI